jgi:hypothetical protein
VLRNLLGAPNVAPELWAGIIYEAIKKGANNG